MHPCPSSAASSRRLARAATEYLADEPAALERLSRARLACAEASLSDPQLATPAGLIAARIGRGVAISVDGELRALHPRPAGRGLAARFAALHARLLGDVPRPSRSGPAGAGGLWLIERRIRPGAAAWLFDDLPFAAVDEVAADALTATARALLRRPAPVVVWAEAATPASPRSYLPPAATIRFRTRVDRRRPQQRPGGACGAPARRPSQHGPVSPPAGEDERGSTRAARRTLCGSCPRSTSLDRGRRSDRSLCTVHKDSPGHPDSRVRQPTAASLAGVPHHPYGGALTPCRPRS